MAPPAVNLGKARKRIGQEARTAMLDSSLVPYLGVPAASLVAAWIGAYFGAYFKKKGENVATKEDIAQITKSQEEIKAQISDSIWNRQRQWELKRDVVIDMIRALADLDGYMSELASMFSIPLEIIRDEDQQKQKQNLLERVAEWRRRADAYQRARNVADIAIQGELSRAASAYFQNAARLSIGFQRRRIQFDTHAQRELAKLRNKVIIAARKTLDVPESGDLPVLDYENLDDNAAANA